MAKLINQSLLCTKRQTRLVQYRERSDRMPHSICVLILRIVLLSVASGRCVAVLY